MPENMAIIVFVSIVGDGRKHPFMNKELWFL